MSFENRFCVRQECALFSTALNYMHKCVRGISVKPHGLGSDNMWKRQFGTVKKGLTQDAVHSPKLLLLVVLRRTPRPLKGGPSETGLNTWANALSNGVGPNHRRASRTASVRFEVALQSAF